MADTAIACERGLAGAPAALAGADQRSRLLAATVAAVSDRGFVATEIAEIAAEAGASEAVFARHFDGKEAAYLAAYDDVVEWLSVEIETALRRHAGWPQGVRTAVEATLGAIAADPRLIRFCGTEPLFAGPRALQRHRATVRRLTEPLRVGREHCAWGAELPDELEETLIGGAIWSIAGHASPAAGEYLASLAPELVYFLLTPYLDAAEARRLAGGV